jgi:hypothetical protein
VEGLVPLVERLIARIEAAAPPPGP